MSDGVPITAGSGTTIATDDCGVPGHAQIMKLAIATDGSATLIPADGTDGLLVNLGTNNDVAVSSIAAGDNNIGNVDVATVPAPLNVTGNGAAATALRVTLANDTTGKVIVSDGTNNIDIDVAPTDGEANGGKRLLHTEAWLWGYNGSTWDRLRSDTTNGLDVDVTRVIPGTTATALGKAVDSVPGATDTGVAALAVRKDTPATLTPADGDYTRLFTSSTGRLWVDPSGVTLTVGSHAVTNAGTFAVQVDGSALTALQLIDDPVIADDAGFTPATSKVMMAGFTLDNTSTDVLDEGDAGAARITSDRRQIVALGESGAKYVNGGGSKTDTTAQSIMAASGDAAVSNYLGWVTVYNSSATNTAVEIRDGTTTVVAVIPAPAYGGAVFQPTYPIKGTANTAFNAYAQSGVTTLYVYGGGYRAV